MAPVANRPFLERMLTWLRLYEVTDVTVALNHLPEVIMRHFGDGQAWGLNLQYLIEDAPLGSGGAIKNAEDLLGKGTFLVVNGDIFTDLNLAKMLDFHQRRQAQMTISLERVEDPTPYGVVDMEADGRLRRFVEKPSREEAPSNYINAGVWLFEPEMLQKMPPAGQPFSVEREFWPGSLEQGVAMFGYAEEYYWLDIGTVERYLQAHLDLLGGRIQAELAEPQVSPGIWLGKDTEIHSQAKLRPPVIIGAHTRIGPGAEITESVVGPNSEIMAGATVSSSVLWEGCAVEAGATVCHSVIGARQRIPAGAMLENAAMEDQGACAPEP